MMLVFTGRPPSISCISTRIVYKHLYHPIVQATPGGPGTPSSAASGERAALSLLTKSAGNLSLEDVYDIVQACHLQPADTKRRELLVDSGEAMNRKLNLWSFGLTSSGGSHTTTLLTRMHPQLTQLLTSLVKQLAPPDFRFTSLSLNLDERLKLHRDLRNQPTSAIIGLTSHTGGELWVEDEECRTKDNVVWRMFQGQWLPGRLIPTARTCNLFQSRLVHGAEPTLEGPRCILVAYTTLTHGRASNEVRCELASLGFALPGEDCEAGWGSDCSLQTTHSMLNSTPTTWA